MPDEINTPPNTGSYAKSAYANEILRERSRREQFEPTAKDFTDPRFDRIWNVIRRWEVPYGGELRSGATGNDVVEILRALDAMPDEIRTPPVITRAWAMPNHETFSVKPIGDLVRRYLSVSRCSVDPFARNVQWASYTNDLNPKTDAVYHLEAVEFLDLLHGQGVRADLVLVDPPYSPRQVKECYDSIGRHVAQDDALLGKIRKLRKAAIDRILDPGGRVITLGWNTVGMGKSLGYELEEILLVCHGSDHNDTIVTVEVKHA